MDKIYTITTLDRLVKTEFGFPDFGNTRTVGWVGNLEIAKEIVVNNYGDIWEYSYDYAVIEEVEEGLYPLCKDRWFYQYNEELKQYVPIQEPDWMKMYVNLGIG